MKANTDKATARPWYLGQCEGLIFANNKPSEPEAIVECVGKQADANAVLIVQAVNEHEALNAIAEVVKDMRHDIEIFYSKYREAGNSYKARLDKALADLVTLRANS